ncbi:MAG: ABC transporter permease [Gammaproteobacteria bacterium]|nr:ABC transporter permease [Gammaproteobacteria bacterium]MDP2347282.1 ABC transporter permease [Gammaproteobacteria bacterium]
MLFKVAWHSLLNRRLTVGLTVLLISVSTVVLMGVEHIRNEARNSFSKTVSGTDLIVGARTGQINLLLYSIFHIGNASNNISWQSYQEISARPGVAWTVPISLGDSHRGYRVVGTTAAYFERFRYGNQQSLEFMHGREFSSLHEAVVGAEVAAALSYAEGDEIVLAHGLGRVSFSNHDDQPFIIVGVLAPTGTPVDRSVHVSLESLEAIHRNWPGGGFSPGVSRATPDFTPQSITAFLVGLESRLATFTVQRQINDYRQEPLLAILPGVALSELWSMMGALEQVLRLIALLVLAASLLGMSIMLLSTMAQRQREIAVMRAMGAHSSFIFFLVELEALLITLAGVVLGAVALHLGLDLGADWLSARYGLFMDSTLLNYRMLTFAGLILAGAAVLALLPAVVAYRGSLAQTLSSRS